MMEHDEIPSEALPRSTPACWFGSNYGADGANRAEVARSTWGEGDLVHAEFDGEARDGDRKRGP